MQKITTLDCKAFLIHKYKKKNLSTIVSDWKRTKKYTLNTFVYRDFTHPQIGNVTLQENNSLLKIVPQEASHNSKPKKPSMASLYKGISDDKGDKLVGNSVEKTIEIFIYAYDEDEEYEYISHDLDGDDGYDNKVTAYYYHSNGRDISLFVYPDNSWIISSD